MRGGPGVGYCADQAGEAQPPGSSGSPVAPDLSADLGLLLWRISLAADVRSRCGGTLSGFGHRDRRHLGQVNSDTAIL